MSRRWLFCFALASLAGCYESHELEEDAGTFEPCTIPVGSAEVQLADVHLSMRSYAYVENDVPRFAAFVEGSDVYIPDSSDECGYGYSYGTVRASSAYELFVTADRLRAECSELAGRRRVEPSAICSAAGCAWIELIECPEGTEPCYRVTVERGELSAFIQGGERPTFCAHVTAETTDGRPLRVQINAPLALCWRC